MINQFSLINLLIRTLSSSILVVYLIPLEHRLRILETNSRHSLAKSYHSLIRLIKREIVAKVGLVEMAHPVEEVISLTSLDLILNIHLDLVTATSPKARSQVDHLSFKEVR